MGPTGGHAYPAGYTTSAPVTQLTNAPLALCLPSPPQTQPVSTLSASANLATMAQTQTRAPPAQPTPFAAKTTTSTAATPTHTLTPVPTCKPTVLATLDIREQQEVNA